MNIITQLRKKTIVKDLKKYTNNMGIMYNCHKKSEPQGSDT